MTSSINWNVDNTEGFVPIGTHSLYLRAAGPVRSTGIPAMVGITGLGDSSVSWIAVLRSVSSFARGYIYNRAGAGLRNSELPLNFTSEAKNFVNMAKELRALLDIVCIELPYVLVMHSFAGPPGREFLHLYPKDVAGILFLGCLTEESYKIRQKTSKGHARLV